MRHHFAGIPCAAFSTVMPSWLRMLALRCQLGRKTPICAREYLTDDDLQRLADLSRTLSRVAVLGYTSPTDYFEIGHLGQTGEDLILHAVGKVGVLFLFA